MNSWNPRRAVEERALSAEDAADVALGRWAAGLLEQNKLRPIELENAALLHNIMNNVGFSPGVVRQLILRELGE